MIGRQTVLLVFLIFPVLALSFFSSGGLAEPQTHDTGPIDFRGGQVVEAVAGDVFVFPVNDVGGSILIYPLEDGLDCLSFKGLSCGANVSGFYVGDLSSNVSVLRFGGRVYGLLPLEGQGDGAYGVYYPNLTGTVSCNASFSACAPGLYGIGLSSGGGVSQYLVKVSSLPSTESTTTSSSIVSTTSTSTSVSSRAFTTYQTFEVTSSIRFPPTSTTRSTNATVSTTLSTTVSTTRSTKTTSPPEDTQTDCSVSLSAERFHVNDLVEISVLDCTGDYDLWILEPNGWFLALQNSSGNLAYSYSTDVAGNYSVRVDFYPLNVSFSDSFEILSLQNLLPVDVFSNESVPGCAISVGNDSFFVGDVADISVLSDGSLDLWIGEPSGWFLALQNASGNLTYSYSTDVAGNYSVRLDCFGGVNGSANASFEVLPFVNSSCCDGCVNGSFGNESVNLSVSGCAVSVGNGSFVVGDVIGVSVLSDASFDLWVGEPSGWFLALQNGSGSLNYSYSTDLAGNYSVRLDCFGGVNGSAEAFFEILPFPDSSLVNSSGYVVPVQGIVPRGDLRKGVECAREGEFVECLFADAVDEVEISRSEGVVLLNDVSGRDPIDRPLKVRGGGDVFQGSSERVSEKVRLVNGTSSLFFRVPLISYGSIIVKAGDVVKEYGYSSFLDPETSDVEESVGRDLSLVKTPTGWTQDFRVRTNRALYVNDDQFIFSVEVDEPQDINVSLTASSDNLILKELYIFDNNSWREINSTKIPSTGTVYFRQDYGVEVKQMPGAEGKFNITVVGDKGFYALSDPWYNSSWERRRAVNISNGGSSQTDYQIKVNVSYDSDMQSDFDDIRFTRSDETTLLDYWMESYTASTSAVFWVEVNSIPAGSSTIYMYYGNGAVGNTSNGNDTFLFFDDFDGTLGKWTQDSGTWSLESFGGKSVVSIEPSADNNYLRAGDTSFGTGGFVIETRLYTTQSGDVNAHPGIMYYAQSGNNDHIYFRPHSYSTTADTVFAYYSGSLNVKSEPDLTLVNWNTWHKVRLDVVGDSTLLYADDVYSTNLTGNTYDGSYTNVGLVAHGGGKDYFDYYLVRKYASTEPTVTFFGSEHMETFPLGAWSKKRAVNISNSGSAQTNYPVKVNVTYDSDMQPDFDDIRFTGGDDTVVLDYWLENYTAGTSAIFWVEVDSVPSGNSTIYLYYGNSAVSTTSNGTETFILFDDFDGSSLDTGKWNYRLGNAGSVWVSGGELGVANYYSAAADRDTWVNSIQTFGTNHSAHFIGLHYTSWAYGSFTRAGFSNAFMIEAVNTDENTYFCGTLISPPRVVSGERNWRVDRLSDHAEVYADDNYEGQNTDSYDTAAATVWLEAAHTSYETVLRVDTVFITKNIGSTPGPTASVSSTEYESIPTPTLTSDAMDTDPINSGLGNASSSWSASPPTGYGYYFGLYEPYTSQLYYGTSTSYSHNNLQDNMVYCYRARVQDAESSSYNGTYSYLCDSTKDRTGPSPSSLNLSADNTSNSVQLNWSWSDDEIMPDVDNTGLVGRWDFEEGSGNVTVDGSGYANTGTLTNMDSADWVSGLHGDYAIDFDGVDDYVGIDDISEISAVSFWVYPASNSQPLMSLNSSAYLYSESGVVTAVGFGDPDIYVNGVESSPLMANQWNYVLVTTSLAMNGTDIKFGAFPMIDATGGTITIDGVSKIHTFTSSGTFNMTDPRSVEVLVVAGGGGGGNFGGGGGGGGLVYNSSYYASGAITVTVGEGGDGDPTYQSGSRGSNGSDSVFGTITAAGGGGGGSRTPSPYNGVSGGSGGSGGGGSPSDTSTQGIGGSASPAGQGNNGGNGATFGWGGAGGGGAGAVGGSGSGNTAGNGGDGLAYSISGSSVYYAGGGGGCSHDAGTVGSGGNGGGGSGGKNTATGNGGAGTANTGGGGGGSGAGTYVGGDGGSGVVIVRYSAYQFLNGTLDDVRIYNRTLSEDEIRNLLLVGQWHFDEGSGTDAYDASGYGNNGSFAGDPSWGSGRLGGALEFDGSGDYINCGNSSGLVLGKSQTIEALIKYDTDASDWVRLVGKGDVTYRNYGLWVSTSGTVLYQIYSSGGGGSAQTTLTVNDGNWHHLVGTYNGTKMKVYVDGIERASTDYTQTPYTSSYPMTIGYAGFHTYFNGTIDEVRIWRRALSESEIQSRARYGVYRANESSGTYKPLGGIYDDFSDGDYTADPVWSPQAGNWSVSGSNLTLDDHSLCRAWITTGNTSWTDYIFEADILFTDSDEEGGLLWRMADDNDGYMIAVRGRTGDDNPAWEMTNLNSGCGGITAIGSSLLGFTVENETTYHLKVIARGVNHYFYVNDILQYSFNDSTYMSGKVGIWSYTTGLNVDNVKVTPLIDDSNLTDQGVDDLAPSVPSAPLVSVVNSTKINVSWSAVPDNGVSRYYYVKSFDDDGNEDNYYNDSGLVGYWRFHEGSAGSADGETARDFSGQSNDGTVVGASWAGGKYGSALSFDGVNDYVEIVDDPSLDLSTEFTFGAWIYRRKDSGTWERIISKSNGSDPGTVDYTYWFQVNNNDVLQLGVVKSDGISPVYLNGQQTIPLNRWVHIAGVKNSTAFTTYIDGSLDASGITIGTMGDAENSAFPFYVGRLGDTAWFYSFNGSIDEVMVYNRAFSATEVKELYENGKIEMAAVSSGLHSTSPYYVNETSGGSGASDYGWGSATSYLDSDLSPNTQYCYAVSARDNGLTESVYSTASCNYTLPDDPVLNSSSHMVGVSSYNMGVLVNASTATAGGADHYHYVWDQVSDTSVSSSDTEWDGSEIQVNATSIGDWYLHVISHNPDNVSNSAGTVDLGPFVISSSFAISLNSPSNGSVTLDDTPDHNFTVSGMESTYSCELFINGSGYGVNSSVTDGAATVITANESLSDGTYEWHVNCTGTDFTNQSETRELTVDQTSPVVSFRPPTEDNGTVINVNYTGVNVSVDELYLDTFIFDWNGTNYTFLGDAGNSSPVYSGNYSDLVLALNFNEGSGNNTRDWSSYGSNGTIRGSALKFDGVNDYVDVASPSCIPTGAMPRTMAFWFRLSSAPQNYAEILDWGSQNSGGGNRWSAWLESNKIGIESVGSTVMADWTHDTGWHYFVATLDEGGTTDDTLVFLDGEQLDLSRPATTSYDTDSNISLGCLDIGSKLYFFNGTIDEIRIYNRSLSVTEIQEHYNGIYSNEAGLVLYLPLSDRSGTTADDKSGLSNDGTLTDFADTTAEYGDTHDSGWTTYGHPLWTDQGRYAYGMRFNGFDDYVSTPLNVSSTNVSQQTITAWFKSTNSSWWQSIVSSEYNPLTGGGGQRIIISPNMSTISMAGWNGTGAFGIYMYSNLDLGWHNVVYVLNESELSGYLDGVFINSTPRNGAIVSDNYNYWIGLSPYTGGSYPFNGTIDDVRIYNRSLSAEEIRLLYESSLQRYNSTEWQFYANVTNLSNGVYIYYSWANDSAGSSGETDGGPVRYLTVDSLAPSTTASAVKNDSTAYTFNSWTNSTYVNVTLSCDDGTGSGCDATLFCMDATNTCTPFWLYGSWSYRIPLTVSNTAGNLTDYQVRIDLNSSNVGSGFNWTEDENATRFTYYNSSSGEESACSYWVENWSVLGENATVWVKVPFLENDTNSTIYFYYGNPSAESESNGTDTFEFFDDFLGISLDTNKWGVTGTLSQSVSGGYLTVSKSGSDTGGKIYSKDLQWQYYAARMKGYIVTPPSGAFIVPYIGFDNLANSGNSWNANDQIAALYGRYTGNYYALNKNNGDMASIASSTVPNTTEHIFDLISQSTSTTVIIDDGVDTTEATSYVPSGNMYLVIQEQSNCNPQKWDWVIVRKYASTEPSNSFGLEESPSSIRISDEGTTYVRFRSNDSAGNLESINSEVVKIDYFPPSLNFMSPTEENGTIIDMNWTRVNVSTDEAGSGLDSFVFNWNGTNYSFLADAGNSSPVYSGNYSDLVLALNFNEGVGNITEDFSGYGNNGTLRGSALKFDGSDDYVNCSSDSSLDLTDEITIEAWVNPDEISTDRHVIFERRGSSSGGYSVELLDDGASRLMRFSVIGVSSSDSDVDVVSENSWQHLVWVYDTGTNTVDFYVNGESAGQSTSVGDIVSVSATAYIGLRKIGDDRYFNGSIDDVRIYNRSLSATEVGEHYNAIYNNETGLVLYIPFSDLSGTTADDKSGLSNNGTLANFTDTTAEYGDTHDSGWTTYGRPLWTNQGRYAYGMSFNGFDDYISVGNDSSMNLTNDYTISLWINAREDWDSMDSDYGIFDSGNSGSTYYHSLLKIDADNTDQLQYVTTLGGTQSVYSSKADWNQDQWYHLVIVHNSSDQVLWYIDGEQDDIDSFHPLNTTYFGEFQFGKRRNGVVSPTYFNGTIDDVRIFNRSLTAEEVRLLYASSLQSHNSTQWRFYVNVTNLTDGIYTYYAWANDSLGAGDYTVNYGVDSPRYLTVSSTPASPLVSNVSVGDLDGGNVELSVADDVLVYCNATLTDNNGWDDILSANATLYRSSSNSSAADDKNNHYSNSSCTMFGGSGTERNVSCSFILEHEALSGTWTCNLTAYDSSGEGSGLENVTVDELVALNILEDMLDFGSMSVGENSSSAESVNVSNDGNRGIDVRVNGSDLSCDEIGSVGVGNMSYSTSSGDYDSMSVNKLSGSLVTVSGFNLGVEGVATGEDLNSTKLLYWTVLVPSGVRGVCSNTVTVTAVIDEDSVESYFVVQNASGSNVATFSEAGAIVLKGSCISGGSCASPPDGSFVVQDASNVSVSYVDLDGNLCIQDTECTDFDSDCSSPPDGSFIVQNDLYQSVLYINSTGNLCMEGELTEYGTP